MDEDKGGEVNIKNVTYFHLDGVLNINDFDLENIVLNNITTYNELLSLILDIKSYIVEGVYVLSFIKYLVILMIIKEVNI